MLYLVYQAPRSLILRLLTFFYAELNGFNGRALHGAFCDSDFSKNIHYMVLYCVVLYCVMLHCAMGAVLCIMSVVLCCVVCVVVNKTMQSITI